jgi:hypothetical protein
MLRVSHPRQYVTWALPAETIKDDQRASMFLVDARPHKIDDGDVVPRLTSRTESMAEHEPEGGLEHCFVGLLKASLLVVVAGISAS